MVSIAPDFYPVVIRETRYGTYEHGAWALIAGLRSPSEQCDAFAGDTPCRKFWERVREEGPIIDVADPYGSDGDTREIYVAAGMEPATLVNDLQEFLEVSNEYRTVEEELERELDYVDELS